MIFYDAKCQKQTYIKKVTDPLLSMCQIWDASLSGHACILILLMEDIKYLLISKGKKKEGLNDFSHPLMIIMSSLTCFWFSFQICEWRYSLGTCPDSLLPFFFNSTQVFHWETHSLHSSENKPSCLVDNNHSQDPGQIITHVIEPG